MTTEQTPQRDTEQRTAGQEPAGESPDWWHRDHPTFIALAGFFSGMLCVTLVPGAFAGIAAAAVPLRHRRAALPATS